MICGPWNTALITSKGELLLHGNNESGQLAIGQELSSLVPFFPEFRKIDYFTQNQLEVIDCGLSAGSTHVLARAKDGSVKMVACGDNEQGQLGNGTNLASQEMIEIPTEQNFE